MPHTIRVRGPWHLQPLARAATLPDGSWRLTEDDLPPACKAEMPADWGNSFGNEFRGLVRHSRKFHRPTGLDANSRVWLVIDNVDFQAAVALNHQPLGLIQLAGSPPVGQVFNLPTPPSSCPARFDITQLLAESNRLSLDILLPPDSASLPRPNRHNLPGGLIGMVRLDIDP